MGLALLLSGVAVLALLTVFAWRGTLSGAMAALFGAAPTTSTSGLAQQQQGSSGGNRGRS